MHCLEVGLVFGLQILVSRCKARKGVEEREERKSDTHSFLCLLSEMHENDCAHGEEGCPR